MLVAIILARGGSQRVPRKNVRPFCGRPMIAWPIAAARASGVFDAVLVSTEDEEIAAVAMAHGAEAPFRRPLELADDRAGTLAVMAHAVRWVEEHRGPVDLACCIYGTAAFLRPEFLQEGLALLRARPDADFTFSVTSYGHPIFRAFQLAEDGRVAMFWPEHERSRSQDLPAAWHDAGQFYWGRPAAFKERTGIFSARAYGVAIPRHLVQDIDTPEDWELAERMFAARSGEDAGAGCRA
jgi:N-acylneuraminate cytidylyltransferase